MDPTEFFAEIKRLNHQAQVQLDAKNFTNVSRLMFQIRSIALAFSFFKIAYITGLGERVSDLGIGLKSVSDLRKCHGCIWDVLTTLDYMIARGFDQTTEEQKILLFRIETTLKALGEVTQPLSQPEIDVIVRTYEGSRIRSL